MPKVRKARPTYTSFATYIHKMIPKDAGVSRRAMTSLDSIAKDFIRRVTMEADEMCKNGNADKKTISAHDVLSGINIMAPPRMAKFLRDRAQTAVGKAQASKA